MTDAELQDKKPLLDEQAAESMFGSKESVDTYLKMFIELYPDWEAEVSNRESDGESLASYLHKVAGACITLGLTRLASDCRAVEVDVFNGQPYSEDLKAVRESFTLTFSYIEERISV